MKRIEKEEVCVYSVCMLCSYYYYFYRRMRLTMNLIRKCSISALLTSSLGERLVWFIGRLCVMMDFHYSTLYCAKGNYEFGVTRVMKSLEPYKKKVRLHIANLFMKITLSWILLHVLLFQLGTETWFYCKRCFLSLLENMASVLLLF